MSRLCTAGSSSTLRSIARSQRVLTVRANLCAARLYAGLGDRAGRRQCLRPVQIRDWSPRRVGLCFGGCETGEVTRAGSDTEITCTNPTSVQYTTEPCTLGNWNTLGQDTQMIACSVPGEDDYVIGRCYRAAPILLVVTRVCPPAFHRILESTLLRSAKQAPRKCLGKYRP